MASIVERRGRFCVVYSYKDKNGKRRQKWETYKTMSEAKKRKKEIEYRADIGQMIVPHSLTNDRHTHLQMFCICLKGIILHDQRIDSGHLFLWLNPDRIHQFAIGIPKMRI